MITKQNAKVENGKGRKGTIESGIPFRVANRVYVSVRWADDNTVSNVKAALLKPAK